ncbi:MAG: hypothetical protein QXW05_05070 [Ignisphaera sp.]
MLIGNLEGWKKYFKVHMVRALNYCERICLLYERLKYDISKSYIKKIIIGVVERNTVGYCRDIQDFLENSSGLNV